MDRHHLGRQRPGRQHPGRGGARITAPPALLASLLASLLTVACQTTAPPASAPPPAPRGLEDGPARPFNSSSRGWTVTIHKPASGKTFCQAQRLAPEAGGEASAGPRLVFRTASAESGFILTGSGATVTAGERYDLSAALDLGARVTLGARGLPDGGLYVAIPTRSYLEELSPFARSRRAAFRSAELGELGTVLLNGSSWAINASDECRILHADP